MQTTSRDYARPPRPLPVRLANLAGRLAPHAGPLSLHPDRLIAEAQRAERLTDFGDPHPRRALGRLCHALETEAALHPLGRVIQHVRLVGALRARLRVQALLDADPAIGDRPVVAPIVITGLQRTGTTFLHRLLAADPRLHSLASYEALQPAPLRRRVRPGAMDPRLAQAHQAARAVSWLAPDFQAVHPIDPDGVEEEVVVLDQTFLSTVAEATLHVPTFAAWLEGQDQRPAYAYLKRVLQLLQGPDSAGRWVLKTPHHLEWLDTLLDVFPDAIVIHTHRDPVTTVASFCSMVAHGRGLCTDAVDPHEVGRHWLRKVGRMVDRAMATRWDRGDHGFHDVHYDALTGDPTGTVERLYDAIGLGLPDDIAARIEAVREASPQHRFGKHVYELGDFGITTRAVAERLAAYRARFGLA